MMRGPGCVDLASNVNLPGCRIASLPTALRVATVSEFVIANFRLGALAAVVIDLRERLLRG